MNTEALRPPFLNPQPTNVATIPDDIIQKLSLQEDKHNWVGNSRLYKLRVFRWYSSFGVDYMLLESNIQGNPMQEPTAVTVIGKGPRFYAYVVVSFELLREKTVPWLKVNLQQRISKQRPRQHFYGRNSGA